MVETLTEGIVESIRDRWGEEYKIYTESVYQNVLKPCFFVECQEVRNVQLLGRKFFLRVKMKVSFFNDGDEKKHMGEKLVGEIFSLMNTVKKDGNIFYGRGLKSTWENDALIIIGEYDLFEKNKKEDAEMMESVEIPQKGCFING